MKDFQKNIISAENQNKKFYYEVAKGNGIRVLFVGNSITKHSPKPEVGWNNNCGMAASSVDKDYVHILTSKIREYHTNAAVSILQVARYEMDFEHIDEIPGFFEAAEFKPDIVTMFFGANVNKAYDTAENHTKTFGKAVEDLRNLLDSGNTFFLISQGFYIRPVLDAEKEAVAKKYGDAFVNMEDIRQREDTHGQFNHPGDVGMQAIADRFWEVLEPVVKNLK